MARFQCRACGFEGNAPWDGRLICPHCRNDHEVRAAIAAEEMTEGEIALIAKADVPSE